MQGAREAEAANRAARRRRGAGEGELAAAEAEFGAMFVSLAGPAGLLDMEKCLETAGRMGDAASRSGYGAGARMAASLAGIFADVADIVNRPVDDGAIDGTYDAFRSMMGVLFGAGEEYRSGGDPEPAGWLEEVREDVDRFRSWADASREEIKRAGLQGSAPAGVMPAAICAARRSSGQKLCMLGDAARVRRSRASAPAPGDARAGSPARTVRRSDRDGQRAACIPAMARSMHPRAAPRR